MSIKDFFAEVLLGPAHSEVERRERDEAFWQCVIGIPFAVAFLFGLPWAIVMLAELLGNVPH